MFANNARISGTIESSEWDLEITRVFDAPRELVFKAWTDTEHVAQWWGPNGFTNPVCEMDVRVGGAIRIDMCAPNGVVYPMSGVFQEVVEPERLVFLSSALDAKGNSMFDVLNTVIFAEYDGKTSITLQARVVKATGQAPQYLQGMRAGWTQSLDRLGAHLAAAAENGIAVAAGEREIVCKRIFDAPPELLWQMFTDPRHVVQWFGPSGFTTTIQEMDVRPGGHWRLIMHGPDGRDYQNRNIFREVVPPERLVYEHCPEKGTEPVSFLTTVTFTEQSGKTRIDFRTLFPSGVERDDNSKKYKSVEGLTQTLARLAEHVSTIADVNSGSATADDSWRS